ncbi:hypothetical protein DAI22_06g166200 [Oryza sativa Japonica Group]|nr:hypothetical protein DAI22_06g166200 [Oryza sativa Japonica Group]
MPQSFIRLAREPCWSWSQVHPSRLRDTHRIATSVRSAALSLWRGLQDMLISICSSFLSYTD